MNKPVIGALEMRRRDALVDYYRGHVADPDWGVNTVLDMDHAVLMATQVTDKVDTSPLAEMIACLQRYLGRIYNRMEPGYTKQFSADELEYWHKRLSNISDFAGYMMLQNDPQNYISPGLRLNKTKSFIDLENNLSQSRISDASVQAALYEHLGNFEKICNLQLISGYIDSSDKPAPDANPDEPTFKNTHYYMIGRQTEQPYAYYWRKVRVHINEANKDKDYLNPADWTEWEELQLPSGLEVLAIRPVVFGGRLSLVYIEGEQGPDEKDKDGVVTKTGPWSVEAKLSWLGLNNIWSTPISLRKEQFAVLDRKEIRLVAVTVAGARKDVDDWLAVSFTSLEAAPGVQAWRDDTAPGWLFACVDAFFLPQAIKVATLQSWSSGRFKDQRSLQHKVTSDEYAALGRVLKAPTSDGTIEGDLSDTLGINLNFSSRLDEKGVIQNRLQVQGLCQATRKEFNLTEIVLVSRNNSSWFEISYAGPRKVLLTCYMSQPGNVELLFQNSYGKNVVLGGVGPQDFSHYVDQWHRARKNIELSDAHLEELSLKLPSEVLDGAGMSIRTSDGIAQFNGSVNKISTSARPQTFGLTLFDGDKAVETQNFTFYLVNMYSSGWLEHSWSGDPTGKTLSVRWGDDGGARGRDKYDVTINQALAASALPWLDTQASGAQFLDLTALGLDKLKFIRLNSPFGPVLKSKVALSIDELLSWKTQHSTEPGHGAVLGGYSSVPMDFKSAHGVFYWQLFFHVPFLIAHRLCEERNYLESQRYFHYIFDPQNKRDPQGDSIDLHWRCRPLLEPGYAGAEANNLVDPDAMAYASPVIYRKTIFMGYVRCLLACADNYYRRLTRDDLVAAKLMYERALALLGPKPDAAPMSYWLPQSASDILQPASSRGPSKLEQFSQQLEVSVATLPERVVGTPQLAGLELDEFRPPTNEMLLDMWRHIEQCLDNMANNLTLDGKPMFLPLFAPPTNPLDLLRAQAGGSSGAARSAGAGLNIPHYRFPRMYDWTLNNAQTLMRFSQQLLDCMIRRDSGLLEELQTTQMMEMSKFATEIQQATIDQLKAGKEGSQKSKELVEKRAKYYKDLHADPLIAAEIMGDYWGMTSRITGAAAIVPTVSAGALEAAPDSTSSAGALGLAGPGAFQSLTNGDSSGPVHATARTLAGIGAGLYAISEISQRTAFYARRAQEWTFQEQQATAEIAVLDEQIKAQEHAILAAEASLRQAKKSTEQAQAIYSFHKTRATNVELYRWLVSQMATHYYQAYDAVVSMCLSTQAAWQYEMGDYDTTFVRANVWMDNYHGLLAAESITLDLMRMHSAFIQRHQRRLEVTRTFCLRGEIDARAKADNTQPTWKQTLQRFCDEGVLDFEFTQQMFDQDFPGHYCRQITTVDVTFPAVLGPYQDTRVLLTQLTSTTAVKPVVTSLDCLYAPEAGRTPLDIKLNLRNSQQIVVSTGIDDRGLHTQMDDRYLPFEGTGAVSKWRFELPMGKDHTQRELCESLTDIYVRVHYLALPGNTAYTQAVIDKLTATRASGREPTSAEQVSSELDS